MSKNDRFTAWRTAAGIALVLAGVALSLARAADAWPTRNIRLIVPYAVGGGSDILARTLGAGLSQAWGQSVVVDNKTGASGNIGTQEVVRASGDGYTLLMQNTSMLTYLGVMGKLPYDPEHDLTPIMLVGLTPIALVANPDANVSNLKELVAAAKARPDAFNYGSCGIGTPQHFVMELLKQKTGMTIQHAGYKGCAPAVTDVLGNQVSLAIVSANLVAPYAKTGKLKVIGVTGSKRYSLLPDSPTFEEQGIKPFDYSIWYALMGPANLPAPVVQKISADVTKILADPTVAANLTNAGVEAYQGSATDLAKLIKADAERYPQIAKSAGIKSE
ncbi:tripartite tricarboxylate transporter substrate binding protein [soil metagenome]